MAEGENPKEFPDVNNKLAAPKKLSAFEKERQAAQAKEKRAEAENAAALKAFEDSFAYGEDNQYRDDDDRFSRSDDYRGPPGRGPPFDGPPSGRYGMPGGPRSGPGSLGPISGPPPPSMKRKRALDEMREAQEARREADMLAYDDSRSDYRGTPQPSVQDEEREIEAPRLTIHLSSLPPSTSTDDVKVLLKDHLKVYSMRFLPPGGPGANVKRSLSAIATLAADVSTSQVDTAVSVLKDKYLGCGFYLLISRHLSSAAMHPSMANASNAQSSEPFGAESPRDNHPRFSMRNAPPPLDHRGFAPPESPHLPARPGYGNSAQPDATVSVRPPMTIEAIKAVHTVVDSLLSEPDPSRAVQMEAMLMSLPEVKSDDRFAFLYDSRSPAGVYYRYLLWSPEDPDDAVREMRRSARGPERIHEDTAIEWVPPHSHVPFLDLKSLEQVVTEMDYISSEEESDDEAAERHFNSGREADPLSEAGERKYLSPLKRAKLVYLLSRLPTSIAKLRKGDVARVTNFAINHAGAGAEEIVDLLLFNVERPCSTTLAAKYEDSDQDQDEEDVYEPDEDLSNLDSPVPQPHVHKTIAKDGRRSDEDPSNAKLVALYLISDLLSASSTAGARNAWKYRQLFEAGFKAQKTFEHLGRMDRELSWGRLKAEQWKRKIGVVFGIWEGWSVFSGDVHEELKRGFYEPPLSEEESAAALAEAEKEERKRPEAKVLGRFKKVEQVQSPVTSASPQGNADAKVNEDVVEDTPWGDAGGRPMGEDVDGVPLDDVDGVPLDDNVDGVPLDDEADGMPIGGLDGTTDERPVAPESDTTPSAPAARPPVGPRRRMRAEDMFADSDKE